MYDAVHGSQYLRALVCDIVLLIVVQGTQSANPHNDYGV